MAPRSIVLAPFVSDASGADEIEIYLHDHVKVGHILDQLAKYLEPARGQHLELYGRTMGRLAQFYRSEDPLDEMAVKGVSSLHAVPFGLEIQAPDRQCFTLEEGLKIQNELITVYSGDVFRIRKEKAQQVCKEKWVKEGAFSTKDYHQVLRAALTLAQQKVLPKYGFSADPQGMVMMQTRFQLIEHELAVLANIERINQLLGLDWTWLSDVELPQAASEAELP